MRGSLDSLAEVDLVRDAVGDLEDVEHSIEFDSLCIRVEKVGDLDPAALKQDLPLVVGDRGVLKDVDDGHPALHPQILRRPFLLVRAADLQRALHAE